MSKTTVITGITGRNSFAYICAAATLTDAFAASILGRGLTFWLAIGFGLVAMGKIGILGCFQKNEITPVKNKG